MASAANENVLTITPVATARSASLFKVIMLFLVVSFKRTPLYSVLLWTTSNIVSLLGLCKALWYNNVESNLALLKE